MRNLTGEYGYKEFNRLRYDNIPTLVLGRHFLYGEQLGDGLVLRLYVQFWQRLFDQLSDTFRGSDLGNLGSWLSET